MRMCLEFELAKPELCIDYRKIFISFIKAALSKYKDGILMSKYYKDTEQKDFSWGIILDHPQFLRETIKVEGKQVKMIISTDDMKQTGYFLFSAFIKMKYVVFPLQNANSLTLQSVQQTEQKIIHNNSVLFKTASGSPIVVREHNQETNKDKYYTVENKNFQEELIKALKRQAEAAGFMKEDTETITAKILDGKKLVIFHYGVYLDATSCLLEIQAVPVLLQHFYQNGVCARRSSGFGMLNMVAQKSY